MSEVPLDDLVMCIHFEQSRLEQVDTSTDRLSEMDTSLEGGHHFRIAEIVFLPENVLLSDVGDTMWTRASRVSDAKLQHLSKSAQRKTVLFQANMDKLFGELWSSDDSDARTQDGLLVTTIFLLGGSRGQSARPNVSTHPKHHVPGLSAVVLGRQVSRWCPLIALQEFDDENHFEFADSAPRILTSYEDSKASCTVPVKFEEREQDLEHSSFESVHHPADEGIGVNGEASNDDYDTNTSDVADTDPGILDISDDIELWQHTSYARKINFRLKSQRLLILWKLFTECRLNDIVFDTDCIEAHLRSHLQQAAEVFRVSSTRSSTRLENILASFIKEVFGRVIIAPPCAVSSNNIGARLSSALTIPTIHVTVHLFLRALSSRSVDEILHSALRAGKDAANKVQLQELFVSLAADVYDAIGVIFLEVASDNDTSLLLGDQTVSLSTLVDDVLSLVYSQKRFAVLQPEIMAIIRCQHTPSVLTRALNDAFQVFAAQVRETMIASVDHQPESYQQLYIHSYPRISSGNLFQSGCNYRLLLEPASVQVHDTTDRDILSNMKLASIAQFVREFSCIDLEIGESATSLSLQPIFSFSDDTSRSPMKLVLDGRHRIFRVLPSGMSSMISTAEGWLIGDYMGSLSDDGQSVDVDFFAYKEDSDTPLDTHPKVGPTSNFIDEKAAVARRVSLSFTLEEKQGSSTTHFCGDCYSSNIIAVVDGMVSGSTYRQNSTGSYKLSEMTSAARGELWNTLEWILLMKIWTGYVAVRGTH